MDPIHTLVRELQYDVDESMFGRQKIHQRYLSNGYPGHPEGDVVNELRCEEWSTNSNCHGSNDYEQCGQDDEATNRNTAANVLRRIWKRKYGNSTDKCRNLWEDPLSRGLVQCLVLSMSSPEFWISWDDIVSRTVSLTA